MTDILSIISASDRMGIIEALNKTVISLHKRADDCINDPKYHDLEDMYRGDAADHEAILELFIKGDYGMSANQFWKMDTASRDNVFEFFSSKQIEKAFGDFIEQCGL